MKIENQEVCEICRDLFDNEEFRWKRTIHHIDGNHDNDDPKNIIYVHFGCHIRLHNTGSNHPMYGKHHSEEAKRKISKNNSRYWLGKDGPMLGKNHSEETKRKISKSNKGRCLSDETKKKMSLAKTGSNNPMSGVHRLGREASSYEVYLK